MHCNLQYQEHRLNLIPSVEICTVLATLGRIEMSKNHNKLTLMLVLANVFSAAAIRGASTQFRMAMEHVAGKAEELTKAKIKDDPPPPFRKRKTRSVSKFADWDAKKYAMDGKASRDKRAEQCHIKVFGMQELGMVEYRKLMEEVDQMRGEEVDVMALVNKRVEELRERLEVEEKEKQERERRQTQSKTGKAGTSSATTELTQEPRKRTHGMDDTDESRSRTGTKKPKQSKTTKKEEVRKTTGAKKPKPKADDTVDESENRKKKQAQKKLPSPKAKVAARAKKAKKTVTEDDDDWLDDLVIVEKKVPEIEEYDDDDDRDEDYEPEEEVDDDFKIPPLRARKTTQGDKSTDNSKKAKPADAALEDLADFVEWTFPKTAGKKSLKKKVITKQ